jgi:hypothetical protein
VRDFFRRLASERPRTYGATMLGVGMMALSACALLRAEGRVSLTLVLLAPFPFVFGLQALVLGTTPEQLRTDRVTSGTLMVVSLGMSALLYNWITR